ncbi:MAG TPA: hypothetical protein DCQ93_02550 [Bacteroidetes bacterium]|nr:hypothetical protein [Bacteroidota bacterium]
MKKAFFILGAAIISLAVASCNNAPAPMDAAAMKTKADSIYSAGRQAIIDAANANCATAGATESKRVCDSICSANGVGM